LNRIIETLTKNNPDLAENTKIMLKPPKVERMGSKKTAIINFISLCKQLDRHPEHVMNFFLEDLGGTSGAIGNSGLVIKTLLNSNNVENLFKKYISEYVQCQLCRRQNTELIKDEKMRLWNLHCNSCKSNRSVRTIKGAEKKYSDYEAEQQTLNTTSQPAATD
jgi:translation initiation factor 2 subunit 2